MRVSPSPESVITAPATGAPSEVTIVPVTVAAEAADDTRSVHASAKANEASIGTRPREIANTGDLSKNRGFARRSF
jgi:hypothetical protein